MSTAFVDFLGVTFWMDPSNVKEAVEILLRGWLGVECRVVETGKGWNGYKHRMDIDGVGLVAFGGNNDTVHIEITGSGCVQVKDWGKVKDSLVMLDARISRVDLAVDDFSGSRYNIEWCRSQFQDGGFDPARGRKPKASFYGDEGSGEGCTYYVGSREAGKLFRGYEKGLEQGIEGSTWFRCEVEWRNRHREIPLDVLENPGAYFAASYPCFADHSLEQRPIQTVAHVAAAQIEKLKAHAKKQAGRCIHALIALGHTVEEVVAELHTPELPKRLAGHIRALLALDESERTYTDAIAPAWASKATPEELDLLHKAHRQERAPWRVGMGINGTLPRAAQGAPLAAFA